MPFMEDVVLHCSLPYTEIMSGLRSSCFDTVGMLSPKDSDEDPALHIALGYLLCSIKDDVKSDAVLFLLNHGADVNSRNKFLFTPLHLAAEYRDLEEAQMLLDRGADINACNDNAETPMHKLLDHQSTEFEYDLDPRLVQLLVENGANVNAQDKDHTTPLYLAIERKSYEAARILLEHGAKPDVMRKNNELTSLHQLLLFYSDFSAREGLDLARLLLEHGASVNVHAWEKTPLHDASVMGTPSDRRASSRV
jgi:ankyrin repeat protein